MNWLRKHVIKWVREDWDTQYEKNVGSSIRIKDMDATCDAEPILNFRVFPAVGGQVVEFRRYDRVKDHSDVTTYIINKDDDFGEKISKIANLELLK